MSLRFDGDDRPFSNLLKIITFTLLSKKYTKLIDSTCVQVQSIQHIKLKIKTEYRYKYKTNLQDSSGRDGAHQVGCLADVSAFVGGVYALDAKAFAGNKLDFVQIQVAVLTLPLDVWLRIATHLRVG
jgi:hypothetical protein